MQSSQVQNVGLPANGGQDSKKDVPAWMLDPKIFPLDWFSLSRPNIIRCTKEYVSELSKWRTCSKIKILSKLKAVLKRIMMFLHTHASYVDGKNLLECELEEDLIKLVSLYIDMELRVLLIMKSSSSSVSSGLSACRTGTSDGDSSTFWPGGNSYAGTTTAIGNGCRSSCTDFAQPGLTRGEKTVTDRISYWLYTMLTAHDQRVDALLSVTVFSRHTRPVLDPIFRKILSEMPEGPLDAVSYVRHMLLYKVWRERALAVEDATCSLLCSHVTRHLVPVNYASFPAPLLRCLGKGNTASEHARPHNINLANACRVFLRSCRELTALDDIDFARISLIHDDVDHDEEINDLMTMIDERKSVIVVDLTEEDEKSIIPPVVNTRIPIISQPPPTEPSSPPHSTKKPIPDASTTKKSTTQDRSFALPPTTKSSMEPHYCRTFHEQDIYFVNVTLRHPPEEFCQCNKRVHKSTKIHKSKSSKSPEDKHGIKVNRNSGHAPCFQISISDQSRSGLPNEDDVETEDESDTVLEDPFKIDAEPFGCSTRERTPQERFHQERTLQERFHQKRISQDKSPQDRCFQERTPKEKCLQERFSQERIAPEKEAAEFCDSLFSDSLSASCDKCKDSLVPHVGCAVNRTCFRAGKVGRTANVPVKINKVVPFTSVDTKQSCVKKMASEQLSESKSTLTQTGLSNQTKIFTENELPAQTKLSTQTELFTRIKVDNSTSVKNSASETCKQTLSVHPAVNLARKLNESDENLQFSVKTNTLLPEIVEVNKMPETLRVLSRKIIDLPQSSPREIVSTTETLPTVQSLLTNVQNMLSGEESKIESDTPPKTIFNRSYLEELSEVKKTDSEESPEIRTINSGELTKMQEANSEEFPEIRKATSAFEDLVENQIKDYTRKENSTVNFVLFPKNVGENNQEKSTNQKLQEFVLEEGKFEESVLIVGETSTGILSDYALSDRIEELKESVLAAEKPRADVKLNKISSEEISENPEETERKPDEWTVEGSEVLLNRTVTEETEELEKSMLAAEKADTEVRFNKICPEETIKIVSEETDKKLENCTLNIDETQVEYNKISTKETEEKSEESTMIIEKAVTEVLLNETFPEEIEENLELQPEIEDSNKNTENSPISKVVLQESELVDTKILQSESFITVNEGKTYFIPQEKNTNTGILNEKLESEEMIIENEKTEEPISTCEYAKTTVADPETSNCDLSRPEEIVKDSSLTVCEQLINTEPLILQKEEETDKVELTFSKITEAKMDSAKISNLKSENEEWNSVIEEVMTELKRDSGNSTTISVSLNHGSEEINVDFKNVEFEHFLTTSADVEDRKNNEVNTSCAEKEILQDEKKAEENIQEFESSFVTETEMKTSENIDGIEETIQECEAPFVTEIETKISPDTDETEENIQKFEEQLLLETEIEILQDSQRTEGNTGVEILQDVHRIEENVAEYEEHVTEIEVEIPQDTDKAQENFQEFDDDKNVKKTEKEEVLNTNVEEINIMLDEKEKKSLNAKIVSEETTEIENVVQNDIELSRDIEKETVLSEETIEADISKLTRKQYDMFEKSEVPIVTEHEVEILKESEREDENYEINAGEEIHTIIEDTPIYMSSKMVVETHEEEEVIEIHENVKTSTDQTSNDEEHKSVLIATEDIIQTDENLVKMSAGETEGIGEDKSMFVTVENVVETDKELRKMSTDKIEENEEDKSVVATAEPKIQTSEEWTNMSTDETTTGSIEEKLHIIGEDVVEISEESVKMSTVIKEENETGKSVLIPVEDVIETDELSKMSANETERGEDKSVFVEDVMETGEELVKMSTSGMGENEDNTSFATPEQTVENHEEVKTSTNEKLENEEDKSTSTIEEVEISTSETGKNIPEPFITNQDETETNEEVAKALRSNETAENGQNIIFEASAELLKADENLLKVSASEEDKLLYVTSEIVEESMKTVRNETDTGGEKILFQSPEEVVITVEEFVQISTNETEENGILYVQVKTDEELNRTLINNAEDKNVTQEPVSTENQSEEFKLTEEIEENQFKELTLKEETVTSEEISDTNVKILTPAEICQTNLLNTTEVLPEERVVENQKEIENANQKSDKRRRKSPLRVIRSDVLNDDDFHFEDEKSEIVLSSADTKIRSNNIKDDKNSKFEKNSGSSTIKRSRKKKEFVKTDVQIKTEVNKTEVTASVEINVSTKRARKRKFTSKGIEELEPEEKTSKDSVVDSITDSSKKRRRKAPEENAENVVAKEEPKVEEAKGSLVTQSKKKSNSWRSAASRKQHNETPQVVGEVLKEVQIDSLDVEQKNTNSDVVGKTQKPKKQIQKESVNSCEENVTEEPAPEVVKSKRSKTSREVLSQNKSLGAVNNVENSADKKKLVIYCKKLSQEEIFSLQNSTSKPQKTVKDEAEIGVSKRKPKKNRRFVESATETDKDVKETKSNENPEDLSKTENSDVETSFSKRKPKKNSKFVDSVIVADIHVKESSQKKADSNEKPEILLQTENSGTETVVAKRKSKVNVKTVIDKVVEEPSNNEINSISEGKNSKKSRARQSKNKDAILKLKFFSENIQLMPCDRNVVDNTKWNSNLQGKSFMAETLNEEIDDSTLDTSEDDIPLALRMQKNEKNDEKLETVVEKPSEDNLNVDDMPLSFRMQKSNGKMQSVDENIENVTCDTNVASFNHKKFRNEFSWNKKLDTNNTTSLERNTKTLKQNSHPGKSFTEFKTKSASKNGELGKTTNSGNNLQNTNFSSQDKMENKFQTNMETKCTKQECKSESILEAVIKEELKQSSFDHKIKAGESTESKETDFRKNDKFKGEELVEDQEPKNLSAEEQEREDFKSPKFLPTAPISEELEVCSANTSEELKVQPTEMYEESSETVQISQELKPDLVQIPEEFKANSEQAETLTVSSVLASEELKTKTAVTNEPCEENQNLDVPNPNNLMKKVKPLKTLAEIVVKKMQSAEIINKNTEGSKSNEEKLTSDKTVNSESKNTENVSQLIKIEPAEEVDIISLEQNNFVCKNNNNSPALINSEIVSDCCELLYSTHSEMKVEKVFENNTKSDPKITEETGTPPENLENSENQLKEKNGDCVFKKPSELIKIMEQLSKKSVRIYSKRANKKLAKLKPRRKSRSVKKRVSNGEINIESFEKRGKKNNIGENSDTLSEKCDTSSEICNTFPERIHVENSVLKMDITEQLPEEIKEIEKVSLKYNSHIDEASTSASVQESEIISYPESEVKEELLESSPSANVTSSNEENCLEEKNAIEINIASTETAVPDQTTKSESGPVFESREAEDVEEHSSRRKSAEDQPNLDIIQESNLLQVVEEPCLAESEQRQQASEGNLEEVSTYSINSVHSGETIVKNVTTDDRETECEKNAELLLEQAELSMKPVLNSENDTKIEEIGKNKVENLDSFTVEQATVLEEPQTLDTTDRSNLEKQATTEVQETPHETSREGFQHQEIDLPKEQVVDSKITVEDVSTKSAVEIEVVDVNSVAEDSVRVSEEIPSDASEKILPLKNASLIIAKNTICKDTVLPETAEIVDYASTEMPQSSNISEVFLHKACNRTVEFNMDFTYDDVSNGELVIDTSAISDNDDMNSEPVIHLPDNTSKDSKDKYQTAFGFVTADKKKLRSLGMESEFSTADTEHLNSVVTSVHKECNEEIQLFKEQSAAKNTKEVIFATKISENKRDKQRRIGRTNINKQKSDKKKGKQENLLLQKRGRKSRTKPPREKAAKDTAFDFAQKSKTENFGTTIAQEITLNTQVRSEEENMCFTTQTSKRRVKNEDTEGLFHSDVKQQNAAVSPVGEENSQIQKRRGKGRSKAVASHVDEEKLMMRKRGGKSRSKIVLAEKIRLNKQSEKKMNEKQDDNEKTKEPSLTDTKLQNDPLPAKTVPVEKVATTIVEEIYEESFDSLLTETYLKETLIQTVVPHRPSVPVDVSNPVIMESCTINQEKQIVEYAKEKCVKCSVNGEHKTNKRPVIHEILEDYCTDELPCCEYFQVTEKVVQNECDLRATISTVQVLTFTDSIPADDTYNLNILAYMAMNLVHLNTKTENNNIVEVPVESSNEMRHQQPLKKEEICMVVTFPENCSESNKPSTHFSVMDKNREELTIKVQKLGGDLKVKGNVLENKIQTLTDLANKKNGENFNVQTPTDLVIRKNGENLNELLSSLENILEIDEIEKEKEKTDAENVEDKTVHFIAPNPEPVIPIVIPNTAHLHLAPDDDDLIPNTLPKVFPAVESLHSLNIPRIETPTQEKKPVYDAADIYSEIDSLVITKEELNKEKSSTSKDQKEQKTSKLKCAKTKTKTEEIADVSSSSAKIEKYKSKYKLLNKQSDQLNNNSNNNSNKQLTSYIRSTRPSKMVTNGKRKLDDMKQHDDMEAKKETKKEATEQLFNKLLEEHKREMLKSNAEATKGKDEKDVPSVAPVLKLEENLSSKDNVPLPVLEYSAPVSQIPTEQTNAPESDLQNKYLPTTVSEISSEKKPTESNSTVAEMNLPISEPESCLAVEQKVSERLEDKHVAREETKTEKSVVSSSHFEESQAEKVTVNEEVEDRSDRCISATEVVQEWFKRADNKISPEPYNEITNYQTIGEYFFEDISNSSNTSHDTGVRKNEKYQTPDSGIAFDEDSIQKDKSQDSQILADSYYEPQQLVPGSKFCELDVQEEVQICETTPTQERGTESVKISIELSRLEEIMPYLMKLKSASPCKKNGKKRKYSSIENPVPDEILSGSDAIKDTTKLKKRKKAELEDIPLDNECSIELVSSPALSTDDVSTPVRTKGSVKEYPDPLFDKPGSPVPSGSYCFTSPYSSELSEQQPVFLEETGIDISKTFDDQYYESFDSFKEQRPQQPEYNFVEDNPKDEPQSLQAGYFVVESQLSLPEYIYDVDFYSMINDKRMYAVSMDKVQPESKSHNVEEVTCNEFEDCEADNGISGIVDGICRNLENNQDNQNPEQENTEIQVISFEHQELDASTTTTTFLYSDAIPVQSDVVYPVCTSSPTVSSDQCVGVVEADDSNSVASGKELYTSSIGAEQHTVSAELQQSEEPSITPLHEVIIEETAELQTSVDSCYIATEENEVEIITDVKSSCEKNILGFSTTDKDKHNSALSNKLDEKLPDSVEERGYANVSYPGVSSERSPGRKQQNHIKFMKKTTEQIGKSPSAENVFAFPTVNEDKGRSKPKEKVLNSDSETQSFTNVQFTEGINSESKQQDRTKIIEEENKQNFDPEDQRHTDVQYTGEINSGGKQQGQTKITKEENKQNFDTENQRHTDVQYTGEINSEGKQQGQTKITKEENKQNFDTENQNYTGGINSGRKQSHPTMEFVNNTVQQKSPSGEKASDSDHQNYANVQLPKTSPGRKRQNEKFVTSSNKGFESKVPEQNPAPVNTEVSTSKDSPRCNLSGKDVSPKNVDSNLCGSPHLANSTFSSPSSSTGVDPKPAKISKLALQPIPDYQTYVSVSSKKCDTQKVDSQKPVGSKPSLKDSRVAENPYIHSSSPQKPTDPKIAVQKSHSQGHLQKQPGYSPHPQKPVDSKQNPSPRVYKSNQWPHDSHEHKHRSHQKMYSHQSSDKSRVPPLHYHKPDPRQNVKPYHDPNSRGHEIWNYDPRGQNSRSNDLRLHYLKPYDPKPQYEDNYSQRPSNHSRYIFPNPHQERRSHPEYHHHRKYPSEREAAPEMGSSDRDLSRVTKSSSQSPGTSRGKGSHAPDKNKRSNSNERTSWMDGLSHLIERANIVYKNKY